GRGRREVRCPGDVARVICGGLRAAERALVEEEQLEVLPPPERAVEAVPRAVGDGCVVRERLHAGRVERVAELGMREVVDELVVVSVAVEAGRGSEPPQIRKPEPELVLLPFGGHGQRGLRARKLAVRVDRVAEVDVEVVPLGGHAPVDLELVEPQLAVGAGSRVSVPGEREADRRGRVGFRGRSEESPTRVKRALRKAVRVARPREKSPNRDADRPVGSPSHSDVYPVQRGDQYAPTRVRPAEYEP